MGNSHCRTDNKECLDFPQTLCDYQTKVHCDYTKWVSCEIKGQWKWNQLSSLPRRDQALHIAFSRLDCKIYTVSICTVSNVLCVRRGPRTTKD